MYNHPENFQQNIYPFREDLTKFNSILHAPNQKYGQILYPSMEQRMPLPMTMPSTCFSSSKVELLMLMRLLWNEHISWTRMAITALVFKLPSADAVLKRLLLNATQMGEALKPIYGNQIGDLYGKLIYEHLVIAADLVKAAVDKDQAKFTMKDREWYQNADEIVKFLNRINPYIRLQQARELFYKHLDQTKAEATFMVNYDFEKDIVTYDQMQIHAQLIADTLTEAIIKQFPNRFIY